MVGSRKNGLPNLKLVAKPMAVSAGTFDGIAFRGRSSRVYEKCASFTLVDESELKRLTLKLLIPRSHWLSSHRLQRRTFDWCSSNSRSCTTAPACWPN